MIIIVLKRLKTSDYESVAEGTTLNVFLDTLNEKKTYNKLGALFVQQGNMPPSLMIFQLTKRETVRVAISILLHGE